MSSVGTQYNHCKTKSLYHPSESSHFFASTEGIQDHAVHMALPSVPELLEGICSQQRLSQCWDFDFQASYRYFSRM